MTIIIRGMYCPPLIGDVPVLSAVWYDDDAPYEGYHNFAIPIYHGIPHWPSLRGLPEPIINYAHAAWEAYKAEQE